MSSRAREPGRAEPWTDDACEPCERGTQHCTCIRLVWHPGFLGLTDGVYIHEPGCHTSRAVVEPYEPPTVVRIGTLRDLRAASDSCFHPGRPPWCP